ncbi:glutamate ABC transporter substrate-binding protein [Cellulomonas sp. DKR-3]|uniref:Glutamate ABC transporter substrate-binding protein n=1 Tax=Cellulomonas fulva TaxID=2835530 RepID=A0ABS5U0P1_9CELL|nr:glutamate ABC transporter substrate-binding protein [Cellulomonas fulva]MBT0994969.1 glutamate ABC transporter substrate-binding protein [Cellulomonas fulva]
MTVRTARRPALVGVLVGLLALAGCTAGAPDAAPATPRVQEQPAAAPAADEPVECDDLTSSYQPAKDELTADNATVDEIRARKVLRVGVSADTLLMGSRNPISGQIEGFDIDMLHHVSEAIFGDPDRLQLRVITSGQRLEVLENHEVDLVARAFSITCERWESIAFSAEYFHAGQKVLVTRDSDATRIEDLAGRRVCAPDGTTTLDRLADYPEIEAVAAPTHTQCLVLFQQGKVDAITGDDTILAGFAAQDPYAKVVGDAISDEPYGIGVAADQVDLVRYVNAVLDEVKADGRWKASYGTWLGALGKAPAPPASVYGRTP